MDGGARDINRFEQLQPKKIDIGRESDVLPSGTVTFLFTDIEGSTNLLEQLREQYAQVLADHRELLRMAFHKWNGHEIDTQGDSFFIAFGRATDAIACAIEAQRLLNQHTWVGGVSVRVRMGLHTGEPIVAHTGYVGIDIHRAVRVAAAGYGGQVLLSQTTRDLVYQDLPAGSSLRDLGEHKLKDIRFPQRIFQLVVEDLPSDFPPLKTLSLGEEPPSPGKAPFKGLQYFDETDASLFFGRSQVTNHLLGAISQQRFLAVVGASGSGKSSVVRAGLVPALKRSQPGQWEIFVLNPTSQPLESLAVQLTRDAESVTACATLLDDLRREVRSLHLYARKQLEGNQKRWLLVIDQFEELFTMCRDGTERKAFVDNILFAAQVLDGKVHVLVALRADFYERLAEYTELRQAVAKHQEYLGAMTTAELRQAIEEPAKLGGWEFSPGLVELMLHEVGAEGDRQPEPGALPLLSHALLETWNRRRGNLMNLKAYTESGGVNKAIARTAENLYTQMLTPAQQQIARNIFLRLTELGEGNQDTRRRVSLSELYPPVPYGNPKDVEDVLNKLADARLIITSQGTAEVAHEALIREWPTLREWLMQDREGLRLQRHIAETAQEWLLLERDPGMLYRGARLAQALEWSSDNPGMLNEQEQSFLLASKAAVEKEEAEKELARQRELEAAQKLAEAERQRAEEQSRHTRHLRQRAWQLTGVLVLALILAAAAGIFGRQANANSRLANQNLSAAKNAEQHALSQQATAESERLRAEAEAHQRATAEAVAQDEQKNAQDQAQLAFSRELAAAAINNLSVDPQRSLLLALQASKIYDTPQAENALHQAMKEARLRYSINVSTEALYGVTFSQDGSRLATGSLDGNIYIWDIDQTRNIADQSTLRKIPNTIYPLAFETCGYTMSFSPDGKWLAGISDQHAAKIWEVDSGKLLQTLSGHNDEVISINFSPDGRLVATGSADGIVKVWDPATGDELETLTGFTKWVEVVVFSPDSHYLAAGSDDSSAIIWKIQYGPDGHPVFSQEFGIKLIGEDIYVSSIAFSPDGKKLAIGSNSNLRLYDIENTASTTDPVMLFNVYAHTNTLNGVYFEPSGQRLFTGSWDGLAKIWDATSGQELFSLSGNSGGVKHIALDPNGTNLVTIYQDGSLKGWDISYGGDAEWFATSGTDCCFFNEDGTLFFSVEDVDPPDWKLQFWSVTHEGISEQPAREVVIPAGAVHYFDINKSFSQVFSLRRDEAARVLFAETWDARTGELTSSTPMNYALPPEETPCEIWGNCYWEWFSPDKKLIAISSELGPVSVWDMATGKLIHEFKDLDKNTFPWFSPDSTKLATNSYLRENVQIWDIASGSLLTELKGHAGGVVSASFSPDGKKLFTGSYDMTARVWDVQTGQELLKLSGLTSGSWVKFSPDGKYLATASRPNVKVWDAVTGQELYSFDGFFGEFSPDAKGLLVLSANQITRGYYLDLNELQDKARSRLIRTWTLEECQEFLHMEACPPTP